MNYYNHHIGDFRSGTVNMSRQARWIYRDMLDVYYDTERPLTLDLDALCDEIGVEADEERRIVERILRFKFEMTEGGYRHARCEDELESYRKKASTARANGSRGGRPRKQSAPNQEPSGFPSGSDSLPTGGQSESGLKTNQEPITNNQENPPNPPVGGEQPKAKRERKSRTTLKTFVDRCRAAGEKPISQYRPLQEYVDATGLPMDFVGLCWDVFKAEHLGDGKNVGRQQADWRRHFLNYVEKGYYRLWYARADGSFELTTQGIQAQRFHQPEEVA